MATDKFDMMEAVKFGWEAFKKNWGLLIGIIIITFVIGYIPAVFNLVTQGEYMGIYITLAIILGLFNGILGMGIIKICLKLNDGEKPSFGDLFSCFHLFFKMLAGVILVGLIVMVGFILLIVPGIIWGIKYGYFLYLIVDKEMGPIKAIKRSAVITQGVKLDLFLFYLLLLGIGLLGLVACCVGIFIAAPVAYVACAYIYRKLEPRDEIPAVPPVVQ